jgi:hypothetical protein
MTAADPGRTHLRLLFAALVALAIAALVALVWRETHVRHEVSGRIIRERGQASIREIQAFFGPLEKQLGTIRAWGQAGDLERASLDSRFGPILLAQPALSSITIGGEDGFEYEIDRAGAGVQSRFVGFGGMDHKNEEWYRVAVEDPSGVVHWNSFTAPEDTTGSTLFGSVGWVSEGASRITRVAGLGVAPAALDSLIDRFGLTDRALIALVSSDDNVYWSMPGLGPRFLPANLQRLLRPEEPALRLLAAALFDAAERATPDGVWQFRHEGEQWWTWTSTIPESASRQLFLVFPASDLSSQVVTSSHPLTYVLLALFALSVGLLLILARGWRRRLARMASAARYSRAGPEELRELIGRGESERLEFKSTLRWDLKRDRAARAIELSWLKTVVAFLNTDGGTLLVGVADDGRILGFGVDRFPSDDRYLLYANELVQKFIGMEYARYIRYDLRPVDGERILVVDVVPSAEPAFLRTGDDDLFYVRMGPASRKLNVRQTLDYLKRAGARPRLGWLRGAAARTTGSPRPGGTHEHSAPPGDADPRTR